MDERVKEAFRTFLLAALAMFAPACSASPGQQTPDAGPTGLSPCISDWPAAGRAPRQRAPLDAGPARILWSKKIYGPEFYAPGYLFSNSGLVLSKDHLIFAAGPLSLVDKDGERTASDPTDSGSDIDSPATVDAEGNVYTVVLSGVYSFDAAGKRRWRLATTNQTGGEFLTFHPPALAPDGVLYAFCGDSYLRAIETKSGREIWRQPMEIGNRAPEVMGGAGSAVFVLSGTSGVWAYDTKTGARLGELRTAKGQSIFASQGVWALGWDFFTQLGSLFSFDTCGHERWATWIDNTWEESSGVIALHERLVATKWKVERSGVRLTADQMYLYAADGTVVKGPVAGEGEPFLAGADGAIYTVNCAFSSPKVNQLIAYTSELEEMWRLSLGKPDNCPIGNGVLDDDGVLYLARALSGEDASAEILAIQTQSPGLAESSWPSLRHDNRGTMWLSSLPPLSDASQGVDGSVESGVDAPVDVPLE